MSLPRLPAGSSFGTRLRRFAGGAFLVSDTRLDADCDLPRHTHRAAYVCVVLAGAYQEDWRRRHDCRRGSVLIHPAASSHANRIGPAGARCVNIELAAGRDGWLAARLDSPRHLRLPPAALAGLDDALSGQGGALDDAILELLGLCLERPADPGSPRWLADVLAALEANLAQPHSLADLAARIGLHPDHLARAFREARHETLGAYLNRRRLEWADQAVQAGKEPLAAIALRCGFCDQAHFTRAYRRHFGISPGQKRRLLEH